MLFHQSTRIIPYYKLQQKWNRSCEASHLFFSRVPLPQCPLLAHRPIVPYNRQTLLCSVSLDIESMLISSTSFISSNSDGTNPCHRSIHALHVHNLWHLAACMNCLISFFSSAPSTSSFRSFFATRRKLSTPNLSSIPSCLIRRDTSSLVS